MNLASSTARSLGGLELRCPPLPHTLVEALDLMDHPDRIDTRTVTAVLERDPLVVARLLQTVNSAYYGLQRSVSSPERAVVMLGPVAVVGVIVGMSMLRLRSVLDGPAGDCFSRLIRHSVATAFLTAGLADGKPEGGAQPSKRANAGFTAGLLHDFGKIILVYNFPAEAVALYDDGSLAARAETERETESLLFGADHTEAGEFAALRLRFPAMLADVIRHHHDPARATRDAETGRLVRTVAVANLAAQAMGYAFSQQRSWEDCLAEPAWALFAEHAPAFTPETLAERLHERQTDLDRYVAAFSDPEGSAPDAAR